MKETISIIASLILLCCGQTASTFISTTGCTSGHHSHHHVHVGFISQHHIQEGRKLKPFVASSLLDSNTGEQNQHDQNSKINIPTPISPSSAKAKSSWFIEGPSIESKPDYENIHGPLGSIMDTIFLIIFRKKMAEKIGVDSNLSYTNYQGLMELTSALNARYSDRFQVQSIAQNVLRSLFPSWLPNQFGIMFAKPFPKFSSRMNAWATFVFGQWLMGECEINDCQIDDGSIGIQQGLLVKRCRFLEESGCASVCVNSCKIPTQNFFSQDMGLPLTMTPDYTTGECQFSFGLTPTQESEFEATNIPCLERCPTSGSMRKWHDGSSDTPKTSQCHLMIDENNT